ncbi:hypothetical protein BU23DRAFT_565487 [Bimuria novae-zelandiae CBS 107.79]|uniref:Uncharacterized protein n=1 Tax=Bimuria novae-zelandiae CBS 107.79 TaxID=1447943 RepID=A0A6A5VK37_9PLEO|nr:hypothetical protein BU23DRAFT_565487 [Bimuria novae-zelandiae CBS 107.79]
MYVLISDAGARAFCCVDTPPYFKNCRRYTKETHYLPGNWCEITCPAGHIRIGVKKAKCGVGKGAYCCVRDDPPPLTYPWRAELKEFEEAVKYYSTKQFIPDCPHDEALKLEDWGFAQDLPEHASVDQDPDQAVARLDPLNWTSSTQHPVPDMETRCDALAPGMLLLHS